MEHPLTGLVVNGVISDWVDAGEMLEAEILNEAGKRDKTKVNEIIRTEWAENRNELMDDIQAYLRAKAETAAREAGINLDAEPVTP